MRKLDDATKFDTQTFVLLVMIHVNAQGRFLIEPWIGFSPS